jgi:sigma-B regulation protein RsbU (phosphoserine phosphatase)
MAKLRHAIRAYACIEPDLVSLLTRLDTFLDHFSTEEEFATVQIALLDPRAGAVEVVSAGHPPPILVDQETAAFVDVQNAPILGSGMVPPSITATRVTISPGAALLFYTDGLVERRDEHLDRGLQRLAAGLAPQATTTALCDAAFAACLPGVRRTDDICVLALRRERTDRAARLTG